MKKQKNIKNKRVKDKEKDKEKDKDIEHFCQSVNTILTKINERCAPKARRETV